MKTTSFTLADGTAVNWSTAVVGGAATADVYATATEDGHSQTKLWARAGQPVDAARLRTARYDELPVAVRSSTGTVASSLDTVNVVGAAVRYLPVGAAAGTARGVQNLGNDVVTVAATGTDTIDGGTDPVDLTPGQVVKYQSDGAGNWTGASQIATYARRRTRIYDLRDYGLTAGAGSGLKAAVTAALTQVRIDGGGVIYIPGGTYAYSGWTETEGYAFAATNYVSFVGDDKGTVLRLDNTAVTGPILLPVVGSRVSVQGLVFDTAGKANATGVRIFAGTTYARVEGCSFEAPGSGGVYIDDGAISDVVVTGNHFAGAKYGVITRNSGIITNIAISNNTFTGGTGGDAIEINNPSGSATNISITGNTIRNVTAVGSSDGLGIGVAHASRVTIVGNTVDNCTLDGIHVEDASHDLTITGNTVTGCGRSGISIQYALNLSGDTALTSRVIISSNNVSACGGTSGDAGIGVESGSGSAAAADYIITGNTVRGCGRAGVPFCGILIGFASNKSTVAHNHVSNTIGDSTASGIIVASSDALVTGNTLYDDQGTPTQQYGLRVSGSAADVRMRDNKFSGNGTAPWSLVSGSLVDLAARPGAVFRAGRKWMFLGTSITNGSTASNTIYAFPSQALGMAGTWYASSASVIAGTPGSTVAANLGRLPGLLSTNTPDAVLIETGPNDSSDANNISLASFQSSVIAMVTLVKTQGLACVLTTPTPRGASIATTATRLRTNQQAQWIRLWGQSNGVQVADFHAVLADPATGDLLSTYDSGDGIHPNDTGHSLLAQTAAAAMLRAAGTGQTTPIVAAGLGLATNPLLTTSNNLNPTGSSSITATGTAPTQTMETTDSTGRRPAGNWAVQTLAAGATSVYTRSMPVSATGWAVGDTLAICGYVEVTDSAARWPADTIAGNAQVRVQIANQSGTVIASAWDRTVGRPVATGVYAIGPAFRTFVIPAGTTAMSIYYSQTQPNGASVVVRYATLGLVNLTALGLTA